MVMRQIIKIDEEKCTGCGACIPNCPEGALQIIDGKARMLSDLFCDGLGACIGHCPEGAITIEEREAEPYDERKVMENVVKQGANTIKAHLVHMKEHGQHDYLQQAIDYLKEKGMDVPIEEPKHEVHGALPCGCPGSAVVEMKPEACGCEDEGTAKLTSKLTNWPVQIKLAPVNAPYFRDARLLIAADCTGFALASIHPDFIKGKVTLVGCPKLDDAQYYADKLTEIFKANDIKDVTILHMEVPCCFGLIRLVDDAVARSGKQLPVSTHIVSISGEVSEAG